MNSWTSFDKLSSKVLFDPKSQKYVGVYGQRCIRCWDENTTDLNKVKKISFQKNIASLVQNNDEGEILVLYTSGETESLSSAIANRKSSSTESISQSTFVDCNIYTQNNGNKILTYFEKSEESISLVLSNLDTESLKTMDSYKYKIERGNIPLKGYCVVSTENVFEFVSICKYPRILKLIFLKFFFFTDWPDFSIFYPTFRS